MISLSVGKLYACHKINFNLAKLQINFKVKLSKNTINRTIMLTSVNIVSMIICHCVNVTVMV